MVKIRLRFASFLCNGSAYLNVSHEAVPQWKMKKVLTDIIPGLAWKKYKERFKTLQRKRGHKCPTFSSFLALFRCKEHWHS